MTTYYNLDMSAMKLNVLFHVFSTLYDRYYLFYKDKYPICNFYPRHTFTLNISEIQLLFLYLVRHI